MVCLPGRVISALLAPVILVIGFSFFCCAFNVKPKLPSVQHNVLRGFIWRKAVERDMGRLLKLFTTIVRALRPYTANTIFISAFLVKK